MRELVDLLGHPEQTYPVIHITGTNGKGSTGGDGHGAARRSGIAHRDLHQPEPLPRERAPLDRRRPNR